jgi:hypothetical protein
VAACNLRLCGQILTKLTELGLQLTEFRKGGKGSIAESTEKIISLIAFQKIPLISSKSPRQKAFSKFAAANTFADAPSS